MSNCKWIHKIIDEADQPAALPLEAASHLASCAPCKTFADDRARLRVMLSDMPRVSAPAYFDARLKARLAEAKAPAPSAWFRPAVYVRFGAATAVLAVAVFAAQYSGLLSTTKPESTTGPLAHSTAAAPGPVVREQAPTPDSTGQEPDVVAQGPSRHSSPRGRASQVVPVKLRPGAGAEEIYVPMVILQGKNGSSSVPMLPVSVGAQQRMLNRSGGVVAQPVGVSF